MDNYNALIAALESEIYNAKRPITSGSSKIVDEAKVMNIIAELKRSMPEMVVEAGYIMSDREKIFNQANAQAEQIVRDAQAEANRKLNDSAITQEANAAAAQIVAEARQYSEFLKGETAKELIQMLTFGEKAFTNILTVTRDFMEQVNRGNLDFTKKEQR